MDLTLLSLSIKVFGFDFEFSLSLSGAGAKLSLSLSLSLSQGRAQGLASTQANGHSCVLVTTHSRSCFQLGPRRAHARFSAAQRPPSSRPTGSEEGHAAIPKHHTRPSRWTSSLSQLLLNHRRQERTLEAKVMAEQREGMHAGLLLAKRRRDFPVCQRGHANNKARVLVCSCLCVCLPACLPVCLSVCRVWLKQKGSAV